MDIAVLTPILIASLLGSPHCAGMCGGFVMFYSGQSETKALSHFFYNFGRLITYTLLGALFGYLGAVIDQAGTYAGLQKTAALLTGGLLIYWGLKGLIKPTNLNFESGLAAKFFKKISNLYKSVFSTEKNPNWNLKAFSLGLLSTFLPCGWLYTYAAVAASSGSPIKGALIMAVFWLGTVPMMLGIGVFSKFITEKIGKYLPRLTAILLIVAGFISIGIHTGLVGDHSHHDHGSHGGHVGHSNHEHHHHH